MHAFPCGNNLIAIQQRSSLMHPDLLRKHHPPLSCDQRLGSHQWQLFSKLWGVKQLDSKNGLLSTKVLVGFTRTLHKAPLRIDMHDMNLK